MYFQLSYLIKFEPVTKDPYINYTCITVTLTLLHKERAWKEFESQNVYIINVWGCAEILPGLLQLLQLPQKIYRIRLHDNITLLPSYLVTSVTFEL